MKRALEDDSLVVRISRMIPGDPSSPELDRDSLTEFLHESLKPYQDTPGDIRRGLDYALSDAPGQGGFVLLAEQGPRLVGALVMLRTGMGGYVPENMLLFVAVEPSSRGQGLGARLVRRAIAESEGDIKLHVEHQNPAKRLYERLGFTNKYSEMRLSNR